LAARKPSGIPKMTAKSPAANVSSTVAGNRWPISEVTVRWSMMLVPRLPESVVFR
jgi:hypothetical protein